MYSYFSDLHVDLLAQALLRPGERRLGQAVGRYVPWWAFGFVNETYLVIATDQRLILVDHRMAWLHAAVKMHAVESIPWSAMQETRVKGLFAKKLVVRGHAQNGPFARTLRVPAPLFGLLAPIRDNVTGARAIASTFEATRSLNTTQAYGALPPGQPALHPAASFAPPQLPAYEQTQPPTPYPQAQPPASIPPFNSPGYTSVPPAPVSVFAPLPTPARPPFTKAQAGIPPLPPQPVPPVARR